MDYHNMKRSELQALCKEHKIPANSANSVLIDKLSQLLNVKHEKQKPGTRQRTCIKSSVETIDESESEVLKRQGKKVRFSPEVEYERSGKKQKVIEPVVTEMKGRRRSVAKKVDQPAVDNVNTLTDDVVQIPVKVTRSRAHILEKVDVVSTNVRKQSRRSVKDVQNETDVVQETEGNIGKVTRSKANTVGKDDVRLDKSKPSKKEVKDVEKESEPVKETVAVRARVTRSKAQTVTEESKEPDLSPQIKKKSGRQMEKEEGKVEPSKEVKDVPVRATRSRAQTLDNDSEVANPPIEKKRTRRDTIVADLSQNTSNEDKGEKLGCRRPKKVTEERIVEVPETQDNADKGTRKSRRNKGEVESSTAVNQNVSKVESVTEKKVTRSKAPVAKKSSGSKAEVQKVAVVLPLEEPVNIPKKDTKRKSVNITKKDTKQKSVNIPKKDTKRKSVVQKSKGKGSKKPSVVKKEKVKEIEKPGSPIRKTVGKKQSKDASKNEMKAVTSGSGSKKSRKRSGDPIIEDQIIKPEPVSTRKDSVAKKEQESGVKTPASTKGAKSGDNRSKKRAKLSETKESDSENHVEKSKSMETSTSKMENLDLDDKIMESAQTPTIVESGRRFTRGAIISDRKEPNQSAIKEQNTGVARFSSRKTPGRHTRSGIKVDEKEQPSESTHQSQTFDDAPKTSPEDAEVEPSPDDSTAVPAEVSKEANAEIIEETGNLSALESLGLPTIDELSDVSLVHNQNQEVHVSSEIVREAEVQVAVTSEKSVVLEVAEKEMELTKLESTSEEVENDVRVEEQSVSTVKTVVVEESDNISLEQSEINGKLKEIEALVEASMVEGLNQLIPDDQACAKMDDNVLDNEEHEKASNQKHDDVEDKVDAQEMDLVVEGDGLEPNRDVIQEESTSGDDKLQGLGMDENDHKDDKVTVPESLTTQSEPEKEFDEVEAEYEPANAIVTESLTAEIEPAKELESDIVSSTGNDVHEIPILGQSHDEDEGVDNVSKHESNTNDHVGDDELEPVQNEKEPMLPEVFTSSSDQGPEKSHNEDVPELPEDLTKPSDQNPEPSVSLDIDEVPCDPVDASTSKEAPQNPESVDEEKQMDDNKFMEDYSNDGEAQENLTIEESLPIVYTKEESTVDELATNHLPGDIGAYESPITKEESPVDDKVSHPSTSFKEEEKNEQEDLGNYSHGTDDFQKPVSTNESDDVAGQSMKDDQVSEFQTSAMDEASTPASGDATIGFFNWTDSTLKELLKTPATTKVSHAEDHQQSVVRSSLPDEDDMEQNATQNPDSSLKALFKTPATTQISHVQDDLSLKTLFATPAITQVTHVEDNQQSIDNTNTTQGPDEGNATQNPVSSLKFSSATSQHQDLSLKTLFATQATTQVSHVKEHEQSRVRFELPDEGNATQNPDFSLENTVATHSTTQVSYVQHSHQSTIRFHEDEKEGPSTQNQGHDEEKKSETFREMNFQEFAHKYFDDEEVDYYPGDNSSKDQVDENKHLDLSHHDASGLKDRSFFTGEDNTQSVGPSENPKSEIFDFARKIFDGEVDFGSSDNSGDEMK